LPNRAKEKTATTRQGDNTMNNQNTTGTGLKTIKHEWKAASLDPEQAAAWLRPAFGQWADALANHDKARVTPDMLRRLATAMDAWLSVRDSMLVAALDTSVGVEGMLRISAKPRDPAVRDLITKTLSETLEDPSAPRRADTVRTACDILADIAGLKPAAERAGQQASIAYLLWAIDDPEALPMAFTALVNDPDVTLAAIVASAAVRGIKPESMR